MIWFEATQSDQPEITWMSSLTALPFGSMQLVALVGEAGVGEQSSSRPPGCTSAIAFACAFTDLSVTHAGKSPLRPIASAGGA